MEYLVTMTTRVPDGVSEAEVDDVRKRESAHTRELASAGRVLRLWRPPLRPGEWRTLGLFAANDPEDLEQTLASMPLHIWRTDDVTVLRAHPTDPGLGKTALKTSLTEFLTTFEVGIPPATSPDLVDAMSAREGVRTHELADEGRLIRLWKLPGEGRNLGHWQASDEGELSAILQSLPMADWLAVTTVPLTRHPSDPATAVHGP